MAFRYIVGFVVQIHDDYKLFCACVKPSQTGSAWGCVGRYVGMRGRDVRMQVGRYVGRYVGMRGRSVGMRGRYVPTRGVRVGSCFRGHKIKRGQK